MLSACDNPPATFPDNTPIAAMRGTWWVAHTKARQEKAFAHDLMRKRVSYFLPLVERMRVIKGRKFRPLIPLFPSYVFVCADDSERLGLLRGNRLAGTIRVPDQAGLCRELAGIQQALAAGAAMPPCAVAKKGQRCRVIAGPFEGIEGTVARANGETRLVLAVRSLAQAVYLEIEADLLEPVT
jgi:transcription antitermination factor NusG